jgi:2-polyprenyl-6-hydroxyphenyl methylase/3-demethylubiquinone-9 3-methyltransferase
MAAADNITFSFGQNWLDYLDVVSESNIEIAKQDIIEWLGEDEIRGKSVIDIGSGSGINSLCFHRLGAKSVFSFDYDPHSVFATQKFREHEGNPGNWTVKQGSILDTNWLGSLGQFDVVYSWGVLHHTGAMWDALANSIDLVRRGGKLWVALYVKGPRYPKHLALKQRFNSASNLGKRWMIAQKVARKIARQIKDGRNPFRWNRTVGRGMNVYYDIIDWLGGLPYEVAEEGEVVRFARERNLILENIKVCREGDLSKYVFSRPA